VVVTGRFDVARLAEGAKRYGTVCPCWEAKRIPIAVVALLDGGTALIGDRTLVRAAIDRRGGTTGTDPTLNDRIASLRQRYDVWGLGEQPEGFAAPVPEAKAVESIDRFQFGIELSSGLELGAEIHTRSPPDAEKLQRGARHDGRHVQGSTAVRQRGQIRSAGRWRNSEAQRLHSRRGTEKIDSVRHRGAFANNGGATAASADTEGAGPSAAPEAAPLAAAIRPPACHGAAAPQAGCERKVLDQRGEHGGSANSRARNSARLY
jgi:hypothetical protein